MSEICDEKFPSIEVKMLEEKENRNRDSNIQYLNELPTFDEDQKKTNAMETDEEKNEKESTNSDYSNQKNNIENPNINKNNGCIQVSLKSFSEKVIIIGEENKCKSDFSDTNSQSNLETQEKCDSQKNTTSVNNSIQHDDNSNLNSKSTKTKKFNENIKKKDSCYKNKKIKGLNGKDKNQKVHFVVKRIRGHYLKRGKKEKKIKKEKKPNKKEDGKYELERETLNSCVISGHENIFLHLIDNLKFKDNMKKIFLAIVLPRKKINSENNLLNYINKPIKEFYKDFKKGNYSSESMAYKREIIDNICKEAEKGENNPDLKNLNTYFCLKIRDLLIIYIDKDELDNYGPDAKKLFNDYPDVEKLFKDYKIKHIKDEFKNDEKQYYERRVNIMKDLIKKS